MQLSTSRHRTQVLRQDLSDQHQHKENAHDKTATSATRPAVTRRSELPLIQIAANAAPIAGKKTPGDVSYFRRSDTSGIQRVARCWCSRTAPTSPKTAVSA